MVKIAVGKQVALELFDKVVDYTLAAEGIDFKTVSGSCSWWELAECPCGSRSKLDALQF
jgi:hypothetical protein